LRLRSRDEVTMVLGEGLIDAAPAHRISPDRPGTGYGRDSLNWPREGGLKWLHLCGGGVSL